MAETVTAPRLQLGESLCEVLVTPRELAVLEFIRRMDFGEIRVQIARGIPSVVHEQRTHKLA